MSEPRTAVVVDATQTPDLTTELARAESAPGTSRVVVTTTESEVDDVMDAIDAYQPRLRFDLAVGETPHARVWSALVVVTGDIRFGLLDRVRVDETYDALELLEAYVDADRTGRTYASPADCVAAYRAGRRAAVVVLAAGAGTRTGLARNKVFLPLGDAPVLLHSLRTAHASERFARTVLVVAEAEVKTARELLRQHAPDLTVDVVVGGTSRHESELCALEALSEAIETGDIDVVAIHDAARPLASAELYAEIVDAARTDGGAVPAVPQTEVVGVDDPTPRDELVAVQTPQAFRAGILLDSYRRAASEDFVRVGTDTASCLEAYAPELRVVCVPGEAPNLKITYAYDVDLVRHLLDAR